MSNVKEMSDEELLKRYTKWFEEGQMGTFEQLDRMRNLKQEILARMARGKESQWKHQ